MSDGYYNFVSTRVENKESQEKKKIFSGAWCFDSRESLIETNNKNHIILKDPWDQFSNFKTRYEFIYESVILFSKKLSKSLNRIHNSDYNQRYWNILVLPWLVNYIPSVYYRWEIVKNAIQLSGGKLSFTLFENKYVREINNTIDFHNSISGNDEYNYYIYKEILKYFSKNNKLIKFYNNKLFFDKKKIMKKNFMFNDLWDKLNFYFAKNNKIFLDDKLLKKENFLKMNLNFKQLPLKSLSYFNYLRELQILEKINYSLEKRKSLRIIDQNNNNDFYKFLENQILLDLPKSFIEGYEKINSIAKNLQTKTKLIITGYKHFHSEIFKIWSANLLKDKKTKLFACVHGGSEQVKYTGCLQFESLIADKKIIWSKPRNKNDLQMPPLYLNERNLERKQPEFLTFVEEGHTKYPNRISTPSVATFYKNYDFINYLVENLNAEIRSKILYLPTNHFNKDETKKIKSILNKNYINKSKIVICPYPITSFTESILSGPTILINEFSKIPLQNFDFNFEQEFVKNKISFGSIQDACKHINEIWDDPYGWWNSSGVQNVIKHFKKDYCNIKKNYLTEWKDLIIKSSN